MIVCRPSPVMIITRTSSFSFKGKDATAVQIGNELNVSHILEGSIRKAGDQVRITAKLISTADGSQIWSETFDHVLDSIFEIQDEIAVQVTQQLKTTLLGIEMKSKTMDVEAYNLYLQSECMPNSGYF